MNDTYQEVYSTVHPHLLVISEILGPCVSEILSDGLPGGPEKDWGYDTQLVKEIGEACISFKFRQLTANV